MAKSVRDLSLDKLKQLQSYKKGYGSAANDEEKQRYSQQANDLRASAGIQAGDAGTFSADELAKIIASREKLMQPVQQPIQQPTSQIQKTVTQTQQPTVQTKPAGPSIDELYEKRRQAAIQELKNAAAQQRSSVEAAQSKIDPMARESKTAADVQGMQMAKRLQEMMVQRGYGTGDTRTEMAQQSAATQSNIGNIENQRLANQSEAERALADINTQLAGNVALAKNTVDADRLAALIQDQQRQQELDLSLQEQERQNYMQTIGQFNQDYQAEYNRVANDGDPTNDWQLPILQAQRQQKIAENNLDPVTGEPLPQSIDLTASQANDLWRAYGTATPEISKALGVPEGATYMGYAQGSTSGTSGGSGDENIPTQSYNEPSGTNNYNEQAEYTILASNFFNPKNANFVTDGQLDPQKIQNHIIRNQESIVSRVGEDGFSQLLNEVATLGQQQSASLTPEQKIASYLDGLAADGITDDEEILEELKADKIGLITELGIEEYNRIRSAFE